MKTPKKVAIDTVKSSLSNAEDNLYRATMAARGNDPTKEWGQSGQTLQSIIDGYKEWRDETLASLAWLERLPSPDQDPRKGVHGPRGPYP